MSLCPATRCHDPVIRLVLMSSPSLRLFTVEITVAFLRSTYQTRFIDVVTPDVLCDALSCILRACSKIAAAFCCTRVKYRKARHTKRGVTTSIKRV